MDLQLQIKRILTKVRPLQHQGAYSFAPPLSEDQVATFEARFGVELPAEYRAFLTRVANGGAGPSGGGLPSPNEALALVWECQRRPVPDGFLRTLSRTRRSTTPPKAPRSSRLRVKKTITWAEQEQEELWASWQRAGTLALSEEGCGFLKLLIVTGPARGQVWRDKTVVDCGLEPLGISFLDRYEQWLGRAFRLRSA